MSETESWVEKHRPETFDDIQGNNAALDRIREWAENWEPGDEPQLLVGDPGTGKTTTAYVVADTLDMPLTQYNASNMRKSEDIAEMASEIQSASVDGQRQLALLDEVDGWSTSGRVNRDPMYEVLSDPPCPIILTANDAYEVPDGVKSRVNQEDFRLRKDSRAAKIREIAEKEGVELDERAEDRLAERPDLRSAINDLQMMEESNVPVGFDEREWEEGEFDAIPDILGGDKYAGSNINPDQLVIWLDQAVAKEFRGLEAGVAYDTLARADKWLGRAQSTRNYRYWKYTDALARMIPEVRLTEAYGGYIPDLFPEWYRHTKDTATGETPVARVYRKLKDYDGGQYQFSGSFLHFKNVILDLLLDLDEDERRQIALRNRLEGEELEVLDLDPDAFEDWATGKDSSVQEYESKSQSVLDF